MTPAVNTARKAKVKHTIHRYEHDPAAEAYGTEAAEKLGLPPARVFKTLIASVTVDGRDSLVVGIVPVDGMLDLKALAAAVGGKKAAMADVGEAQRATGYLVGGISPLGQKRRLPTVLDQSAMAFETVHVSAGRRGLEIELAPDDLVKLTGATVAAIAAH